jgi:Tfp pilus assembly protein PilV
LSRGEGGFSVVEVLVAVMVLGVGVTALAGTAALATRQVGQGRTLTIATEVANQRLETLRRAAAIRVVNGGPPCNSPAFASSAAPDTTRGVVSTWTVTGAGSTRTVTQTVSYRTTRGLRTFTVTTLVGCYQ